MGRICTVSSLIGLLFTPLVMAGNTQDELPVVKLSPTVREAARDPAYFQRIPCRGLGAVEARDEQQKRYLNDRRQACLEQLRAFAPRSFQP